jgi:hypothetical protein
MLCSSSDDADQSAHRRYTAVCAALQIVTSAFCSLGANRLERGKQRGRTPQMFLSSVQVRFLLWLTTWFKRTIRSQPRGVGILPEMSSSTACCFPSLTLLALPFKG